jgi:hypothetical protein
MRDRDIEVFEGIAGVEHICHECREKIEIGQSFRQATIKQDGKCVSIKRYHMPLCPKSSQQRQTKKRAGII